MQGVHKIVKKLHLIKYSLSHMLNGIILLYYVYEKDGPNDDNGMQ